MPLSKLSTDHRWRWVGGAISGLLLIAVVPLIANFRNGRLALAALVAVFCLALGVHVTTLFGLKRRLHDVAMVRHRETQFRAAARVATAEADILRSGAHTLAKSPRMDGLLDALLMELHKAVPYDSAAVLLREGHDLLVVAREAPRPMSLKPIVTIEIGADGMVEQLLKAERGLCLPDLELDPEWTKVGCLAGFRSWIGVPLVSGDSPLGLLSIGCRDPRVFTDEHLRLAGLLALSAAVGIRNARLQERAEIYAEELESRLSEISRMRDALRAGENL